jgi:hypothetical protein
MERARAQSANLASRARADRAEGGGEARAARRIVRVPTRQLRLGDLSTDLLALVASALPEDDELAAALCCRKLRAAVAQCRLSDGRVGPRTRASSAFGSFAKLSWAVSCGLPLSPRLSARAAERGQVLSAGCARAAACGTR